MRAGGGAEGCAPPTSCSDQGVQCGTTQDGCGHTLDCDTCSELGFDCGQAGDGCGCILDCGTCTAPQTCGGGGTPGVCG